MVLARTGMAAAQHPGTAPGACTMMSTPRPSSGARRWSSVPARPLILVTARLSAGWVSGTVCVQLAEPEPRPAAPVEPEQYLELVDR